MPNSASIRRRLMQVLRRAMNSRHGVNGDIATLAFLAGASGGSPHAFSVAIVGTPYTNGVPILNDVSDCLPSEQTVLASKFTVPALYAKYGGEKTLKAFLSDSIGGDQEFDRLRRQLINARSATRLVPGPQGGGRTDTINGPVAFVECRNSEMSFEDSSRVLVCRIRDDIKQIASVAHSFTRLGVRREKRWQEFTKTFRNIAKEVFEDDPRVIFPDVLCKLSVGNEHSLMGHRLRQILCVASSLALLAPEPRSTAGFIQAHGEHIESALRLLRSIDIVEDSPTLGHDSRALLGLLVQLDWPDPEGNLGLSIPMILAQLNSPLFAEQVNAVADLRRRQGTSFPEWTRRIITPRLQELQDHNLIGRTASRPYTWKMIDAGRELAEKGFASSFDVLAGSLQSLMQRPTQFA